MALVSPPRLFALHKLPASLWTATLYISLPSLSILPRLSLDPSQTPLPWYNPIPDAASALRGIWEGVLRAVPKQRTTHSRSRHRQMAGKALKDLINIVKCPSCGRPKKSHFLCPYCVHGVSAWSDACLALTSVATQQYWRKQLEKMKLEKKATQ
jgi:ribosomal protein L32